MLSSSGLTSIARSGRWKNSLIPTNNLHILYYIINPINKKIIYMIKGEDSGTLATGNDTIWTEPMQTILHFLHQ